MCAISHAAWFWASSPTGSPGWTHASRRVAGSASASLLWRFFFSSRRRHTRCLSDWSSDVCSSDLLEQLLEIHLSHLLMAQRTSGRKNLFDDAGGLARGLFHRRGVMVGGRVGLYFFLDQIGRASCRGRGEVGGVAGAVTKEHTV